MGEGVVCEFFGGGPRDGQVSSLPEARQEVVFTEPRLGQTPFPRRDRSIGERLKDGERIPASEFDEPDPGAVIEHRYVFRKVRRGVRLYEYCKPE